MFNPYDGYAVQKRKIVRMQEEFAALGTTIEVVANDGFAAYVKDGKTKCDLQTDFVLYFDKERICARLLEKAGIPVFNSAAATEICDDKMLTHAVLADSGIPMPDTVAGPLCYNPDAEVGNDCYLGKVVQTLGLPVVVKECHGSFGEQVCLCDSLPQLKAKLAEIKLKPYLLQRYERQSCGRDMRVIVIGGKAICAMLRTNDVDFRANAALGGKCKGVDIPTEIASLCQKAAQIVGLDYCGVDVLLSDRPKLCEINSNAMFEMAEQVTGVNVARLYAEHILNKIK